MELGTEDIFLEANRKPNGVVQRFGNETTTDLATATGGYSTMASGLRKAIVAVRPSTFNSSRDDKLERRDTKRRSTLTRLVTQPNRTEEPLERKIELEHLQNLAPYFLKPCGKATPASNVFHDLNSLKRSTEVQEWLHGCGEPVPDWSSLVKRKVPTQFSHIRSTQQSKTDDSVPKSSDVRSTLEGKLSPAVSDDTDSLDESDAKRWTRGSKRKAEKLSSLMNELFASEKVALTEQQFANAICSVVSGASMESAAELFQRIDVESTNLVSSDSFVAFLLSQTSSSSANPAVTQSTEFMPVSVPRSCPSWQQHESTICSIVVSLRTGVVYTGGSDGALRSWDPTTLRHQRLWYTCNSWIVGLVLTFREQRLVCTTVDRQLVVFDAKSADILRMYRGRRVLETENGVSFAHDSIPTVTIGGRVQSHLAPKGTRIRTAGPPIKSGVEHSDEVRAHLDAERANQVEKRKLEEFILAGLVEAPSCLEYHFSRLDEDVLFFGMDDGSIRLYILPVGHQRLVRRHFKLKPHTGRVKCMKMVPDMEGLLSCSEDGSIKLTNLETGQIAKHYGKLGDGHEGGVSSFVYSASMKLFLSAGPERHAIVWDQLQESPVARLDDHSCPLLCCAINDQERQFISIGTDSSVFIFDARSYKLMQQFHERVRSNVQSLTTASSTCGTGGLAQQGYSVAWFDVPRQRLILCTTFPVMHQLRRNVATLPATYCGHTSPVVGVIANHSFDLLLTIDAEHLVLGWTVSTGASSGLSFRLNSFTSAHEELRLTSLAFDLMERRLVTGFHCGVVVVWNVFNGQPLCIIRDGGGETSMLSHSSEALAVATLQRESDCTHYVFSMGSHLIPLKETPQFTVANAPRWFVPESLGVVTCLAPCSPVLVACGTSTGALLFFNVLLEHQDGSALFQPAQRSDEGVSGEGVADCGGGSNATRVVGVFALPRVAGRTVAVVHADGLVGFWHSVRRSRVTTIALSSVGVPSGNIVLCAVDVVQEHLVTVDDSGNVAVLALRFADKSESDGTSFCIPGAVLSGSDKLSMVLDEVGATVVHEERPHASEAAAVSSDPNAIHALTSVERVSYFYGLTGAQTGVATVTYDHSLFIVITASDFFTRVFDIDGHLVGELGMNTWNLFNDKTFKYPNVVHSPFAITLDVGEACDTADDLPFQLEVPTGGSSLLVPKPPSASGSSVVLVGGSSYQLPRAFRCDVPSSAAHPVQPHGVVQLGNPSPRVKSQREGLVKPTVPPHERRFSSFSVEEYPGATDITPQLTLNSAQLLAHTGSNSSFVATPYRDKKSTATRGGTVGFSGLMVPAPTVIGTPSSARKSVSTEALSPPREESLRGKNVTASPGSANLEGATEARRTALLARHLDSQLTKLRSCKDDLNEELKRIEARLARRPDTSYVVGSGLDKSSWTSRVAARLHLHEIDDIQPPAGSKASSDTGRRLHHRFNKTSVANTGRAQQRAPDFFPSVTAPGTVLVGEKSKEKN